MNEYGTSKKPWSYNTLFNCGSAVCVTPSFLTT